MADTKPRSLHIASNDTRSSTYMSSWAGQGSLASDFLPVLAEVNTTQPEVPCLARDQLGFLLLRNIFCPKKIWNRQWPSLSLQPELFFKLGNCKLARLEAQIGPI